MSEADIRLDIVSDPANLCVVRQAVRAYLMTFGLAEERVDDIVLAVDEACSNVIRHAYDGRCDQRYDVSLSSSKEWVEIELHDTGEAVPEALLSPAGFERPKELAEVSPGGLGIGLIFKTCDKVNFTRTEDHSNSVSLKVRRP